MSTNPNRVHHNQEWADESVRRIKQLLQEGLTYQGIADTLNQEGLLTIRGIAWSAVNLRQLVHALRIRRPSWYGLSANRTNMVVHPA